MTFGDPANGPSITIKDAWLKYIISVITLIGILIGGVNLYSDLQYRTTRLEENDKERKETQQQILNKLDVLSEKINRLNLLLAREMSSKPSNFARTEPSNTQ